MQLQTTARCKGPPDGAGYRPPETRQQVTQPGRPDAQGPPPAGWPGRGLGARPQYAIRGRGNKFVQLQAINRYESRNISDDERGSRSLAHEAQCLARSGAMA